MLGIVQTSKAAGEAYLHFKGLGTFQVPAGMQAELDAASEAELFASVEKAGFIDPFVLAEICNRGLYAAYQGYKAERDNEAPKLGFGEAIITQLLAE